ncbi:MAG TPA: hypothetical protein VMA74_20745 [Dyella sp.]|uniref:hypothetical protein n=1 Tax=Dyella sp. TaxID=1869338 RepID=UPI002B8C58B5|nr:hypothetical protein [Dyella sp.]HUB92165.1 hypothetical protein [Dyella sp.]
MMKDLSARVRAEFARAMRNFRYERTSSGVYFPSARVAIGGTFGHRMDDGPWIYDHNTAVYEGLDFILSAIFSSGGLPATLSLAPFSNNTAPSPSLTAATFAAQQGEYTLYTQTTRQAWITNGASSGQQVSNSNSVATFTIGSAAATITGAGFIANATGKGATTGTLFAASLFSNSNQLSAGSTFQLIYSYGAQPLSS